MKKLSIPAGFEDMLRFGLIEALLGRRSRRFFMGAEIPDGVFTINHSIPPHRSPNWKSFWWLPPAGAIRAGTT